MCFQCFSDMRLHVHDSVQSKIIQKLSVYVCTVLHSDPINFKTDDYIWKIYIWEVFSQQGYPVGRIKLFLIGHELME